MQFPVLYNRTLLSIYFIYSSMYLMGFPIAQLVQNPPAIRRPGFHPWVGKFPWRRAWQPTPVFLPGESHEQRSREGYSLRGHKESDRTEQLSTEQHLPTRNQIEYEKAETSPCQQTSV